LVAHADWSVQARKRWVCVAVPNGRGWRVELERAKPVAHILPDLRQRAAGHPVALGIDAPIGLPERYRRGHPDFPAFLAKLSPASEFFSVAETADQISYARPFYPNRGTAGVRRHHLTTALGLESGDQLLRRCEQPAANQPAASPLFWTLGAKQVGKGAICLWRDLLLPALHSDDPPAIWPFDGLLAPLLQHRATVIAETYPAHAMRQIELKFVGSKTRQSDRLNVAGRLRAIMHGLAAEPDGTLSAEIATGFGAGSDGEDRFDSLVGLLGMLQVVRDPSLDRPPDAEAIIRWEGWILGRR
jgi:hypothetical protein